MKLSNNYDSLIFHAQGLNAEDLLAVTESYHKNREKPVRSTKQKKKEKELEK